tara:strand:- start:859 stop:3471 length:2613 start_codon:yes stop_codon:yes gene_type:complete
MDVTEQTGNDGNGAVPNNGEDGPPEPMHPRVSIVDEMRGSFRDYSMSVIIGRALPDVRDGLKPVHRRILYAMYKEGLLANKKYSKCAGVVGEVLKKYHPHGDSAVYDALVRLAQPWNMRAPLVDGQGNFGSIDGDPAAAYRYTEAKLTKIAEMLLRDIEKNTVDFSDNFDGTTQEPTVLPSRVPNLLVNGSEGIAVAMATRCPPHNLGEVVNALLAIIAETYEGGEPVDVKRLLELVPGPDFPTGGLICGSGGVYKAYTKGRGSIKVRAVCRIEETKKGRQQIVVDEVPYQVNKARLLERIAELVRDKKIEGIADLRDESDRDGLRIAIDLKKDAIGDIVLNQLYRHTLLQTSYPVSFLSISHGQPRTMGLKDILISFLDFRREVVTRRTRFELEEAQDRFHLVAGLVTALDDIDRIIEIIRSSKDTDEAKQRICAERFESATQIGLFTDSPTTQVGQWLEQGYAQLDAKQAQAILDMRLARLVGLERDKLIAEGEELLLAIKGFKEILSDVLVLMSVIKKELEEVRDLFATPRRTQLVGDIDEIEVEDMIVEEDMVVTLSHQGYIKRSPLSNYRSQRRGGRGKSAARAKDEDFITEAFVASTHAYLLCFTDRGKVYWVKVHRLPEAGPQARGRPIINLIQVEKGEKVCAVLPVREFPKNEGEQYVVTCSRLGRVKKTDLRAYATPRNSGLIACGIAEDDELIEIDITDGKSDMLISSREGMAIRFAESQVRPMGRGAAGVKGINLRAGDEVVSMLIVEENTSILTITEKGFGKRTAASEFRAQARGGLGLIAMKVTGRNGRVADAVQVHDTDSVMLTTNQGVLIRVQANEVSEYGRNTQGVRVMNISGAGESVIAITRIADSDLEEPKG